MSVILLILMVAIFIVADIIIRKVRESKTSELLATADHQETLLKLGFKVEDYSLPAGIFFYKGHTWASLAPSGEIKVGLNDFAQKLFSKIDKLKSIEIGSKINQGDEIITVQQDKKHAQFLSPISGEISAINEKVIENPSLIKKNPYLQGWIYTIKPKNVAQEIKKLKIAEEAANWLKDEVRRLKEFLMMEFSGGGVLQHTLADGGMPIDGIIDHLSDSSWDELQQKFLK